MAPSGTTTTKREEVEKKKRNDKATLTWAQHPRHNTTPGASGTYG